MVAAYRGQTAVAELLLSKGANIEAANKVTIDFQLLGRMLSLNVWISTIIETKYSNFFETCEGSLYAEKMALEWEPKVQVTDGWTDC